MIFEQQRYGWGRAYRDGDLVCGRVHVTFVRDDRLGLAPRERRHVVARFQDRLHPELRAELAELARSRGAAARRVAENLAPLAILVDDSSSRPRADRRPPAAAADTPP